MTDLPHTIKVGGMDYRVKEWKRQPADNANCYGMCDYATTTILVRKGLSTSKTREILLHEVVHACYDAAGLSRKDNCPEEMVVNDLTYQLLGVMRDNPELVAYLTAKP